MSTNYIDQITDTAGTTQDISESDSTRIFRATCSTAASTTAKVATLQTSNKNFSLSAGVRVAVTFTYGNSATTPTLRVDGSATGTAKTIAIASSATEKTTGNGTTYNTWGPYETVLFTYDGTYWVNGGSSRSIYNAYSQASAAGSGTVTSVGISSSRGLSISDSPVTTSGTITINNTGVLTVEASPSAASNGTIAVTTGTASGSNTSYVAVKGLAAAAYKGVTDNSSATAVTSSDTNLITGRTLYYAGYTKNSGTVTSVGISNATNGGLSVSGSPVTGSGTITIGHSNSVTAQTTQAVYPIKIDQNGHISAYGNAVTIPTVENVSTYFAYTHTKQNLISSVGTFTAYKFGAVIMLNVTITPNNLTTGSTNGDILLSSSVPSWIRPKTTSDAVGYYGRNGVLARFYSSTQTGDTYNYDIRLRNIGNATVSNGISFTWTYICQE